MEAVVHDNAEELSRAAASHISKLLSSSGDRATLALAGGTTPPMTYQQLCNEDLDWSRIAVWLGDERWVAPDSERSNGRMAQETLIDQVDAEYHRPIWGDFVKADDSAAHYEATIRSLHPDGAPDVVILGMGDDGHTASLFPGTDALDEDRRWYVANFVPQQDEIRLTATYPLLWKAREVVFLVSGEGKAEAVKASFAGDTPAGRVGDGDGNVTWHLDAEAASLLS